jgi:5-methylcytosine-specific restriction protein A
MPSAPLRPCRKVGCNKMIITTYCDEHQKKKTADEVTKRRNYDKVRGTRTERGYNNRWLRYSKNYRKNNPLCVECENEGIVKLAECVDHIVPHNDDDDMELFWDENNHQSLCYSHHNAKTAREDGGLGNVKRYNHDRTSR